MGEGLAVSRLCLLGQWRLELESSVPIIRGTRTRALVSVLACENDRAHLRSELASLLWPDSSSERARASLRQALAEMRGAIGNRDSFFDADRGHIRVLNGRLETDVDRILNCVENGDILGSDLERLTRLPSILSEFQSIGKDMDDWIGELRASLLKRANEGLARIYDEPSFDEESRLRAARVAFRLDNFNEAAARAIIRSYAASDQISKAIRFYDELYRKFEEDLDTAPSLATQDVAAQLKLNLQLSSESPASVATAADVTAAQAENADIAIAVLPFDELGPETLPEYVKIGLLDEITCSLAGLLAPSPISSNTMRRYLNIVAPSPSDVRKDTGARYVVSGSIRSGEQESVVAVQLADAINDRIIWAEVYRCGRPEILELKSFIVSRIVSSVVPSLHGAELRRTDAISADDLEPFQLVLRAREQIFNLSHESFVEAGKLLERALDKGQHFAPAYALSADWHSVRIWQGWSDDPDTDQQTLEHHARKAIRLRPSDGRVMALLGHNRLIFSRKYDEANEYFREALSLMPSDSETLNWTVPGLTYDGQTELSIENGERALKLSPFDPFQFRNQHFLSIAHYACGNYDRAADLGLASFEDNATYVSNLRFTIASLHAAGRRRKVRELVTYHHEIEPDFRVSRLIARHPFRSDEKREQYGRHLVEAGLTA